MANTKITNLGALTATSGDEVPINRAGTDGKVTVQDIAALRLPAGSDTQVQFNDSSALAGDAGLTYNKTSNVLTLAGGALVAGTPDLAVPLLSQGSDLGTGVSVFSGFVMAAVYSSSPFFAAGYGDRVQIGSDVTLRWLSNNIVNNGTEDLFVGRKAAANLMLGAADAAAPVAQTLSVQNVAAGTADTAGADFTISGSRGTGTGVGGGIALKLATAGSTGSSQNALVEFLRITSVGTLISGDDNFATVRMQTTAGAPVVIGAYGGTERGRITFAGGSGKDISIDAGGLPASGTGAIALLGTGITAGPAGGATAVQTAGKNTLWIPASAMTSRITAGAADTLREINSITVPAKAFDESTDEGVNFSIAFPKSWNASTVTAQAFWTCTGGGAAETIELEIRGGCFANDAAINVSGLGTAVAMTDTFLTDGDVHITAESSAITLSNDDDDTLAFFEIIRDVSDDNLTADLELIGIKLFYTTSAANDA